MNYPLVTVFTLIYNTNPIYVIEAIKSIIDNKYPHIQHIIIDDFSPNVSCKMVVKDWIRENKYNCEFYEHEVNYGICKTLNHVLELAKGKYILGCSDDIILPHRIYNDVSRFEKLDDSYAIIFGQSQIININSELQPQIFPDILAPDDDNYFDLLLERNQLSAPSTTYKTSILKKEGGFNEFFFYEDYEINLRLAQRKYKFKFFKDINAYYRIHGSNNSHKLNYDIENFRILSSFNNSEKVKNYTFNKVKELILEKNQDYLEMMKIYETNFGISLYLRYLKLVTK